MQNVDRQLRQELTESLARQSTTLSIDEFEVEDLNEDILKSYTSVPLVLPS